MRLISVFKFLGLAAGMVGFYFAYSDFVAAEVTSPFGGGGDPEAKLGSTFRDIFSFILYAAMGFAGIAMAWGLLEFNGFIGDKKEGIDKMKRGAIVLATAGVFRLIVGFFAGLSE